MFIKVTTGLPMTDKCLSPGGAGLHIITNNHAFKGPGIDKIDSFITSTKHAEWQTQT